MRWKQLRSSRSEEENTETITSMPKLLADLEHVKQSGYAVDDEENSLGARCLGAHLRHRGNVTARSAPAGTLTQTDEANTPRIIEALKETARGYRGNCKKAAQRGPPSKRPRAREGLHGLARDDQIVLYRENVGT